MKIFNNYFYNSAIVMYQDQGSTPLVIRSDLIVNHFNFPVADVTEDMYKEVKERFRQTAYQKKWRNKATVISTAVQTDKLHGLTCEVID